MIAVIITVTCASTDTRKNYTPAFLPEAVEINKNGIKITVNPSIELLAVIQFLSNYRDLGLITTLEFEYMKSVNAYFTDFKEQEAIYFINRHMRNGFTFHVPPTAALMIKPDFTLDQIAFTTTNYFCECENCDIPSIIPEFISVMKSFYFSSDFKTFFLDQKDFYTSILEQSARAFPDWDMTSVMESFYGKSLEGYNIVLSPLLHSGGYGPLIMHEYGLVAYSVMGPGNVNENGLPVFGDNKWFTYIVLHEFGHSFLSFAHSDNINIHKMLETSEYLMEPIRERMARMAYPNWNIACEELILRAIVIRMLTDNQQTDTAELLSMEHDQGFIYIHTVYDLLQKYLDNRKIYPAFDDFIPILIGELMQIHPRP